MTNTTTYIRPGLDLQGSVFYRAPMEVESGRIDAMMFSDLALRKQLMCERASLTLRVTDLFVTAGFHGWFED